MKRLFAISIIIFLSNLGFGQMTRAVAHQGPIGFVDEVGLGYVKGWVYDNDNPVALTLSFENVNNPQDVRYYSITNTQNSNKISYWSQRAEVENYLRSNYGANNFSRREGFIFNGTYLPVGQWRLKAVTPQGLISNDLPIISNNKTLSISYNAPYAEGYIDTTSEGGAIKGWAFSNANNSPAPEIRVVINRPDDTDQRTFILPYNVNQQGHMIRTNRGDVRYFLQYQRGQAPDIFDRAGDVGYLGFTFDYNDFILPSGNWYVQSVLSDGKPLPYANGYSGPPPIITVTNPVQ